MKFTDITKKAKCIPANMSYTPLLLQLLWSAHLVETMILYAPLEMVACLKIRLVISTKLLLMQKSIKFSEIRLAKNAREPANDR